MIFYRFDRNHRVYERKPTAGYFSGAPLYSEHFIPYEMQDETDKEYICDHNFRINKKSMKGYYVSQPRYKYAMYTEAEREAEIWKHDHVYKLGEAVRKHTDLATLKQIAKMVGYDG